MSLIEDIKRDHEAGTRGPWFAERDAYEDHGFGWFISGDGYCRADIVGPIIHTEANAHRIARVPEMEAALMAADELAAEMDRLMPVIGEAIEARGLGTPYGIATANKARATLAAYRKAMGDAA